MVLNISSQNVIGSPSSRQSVRLVFTDRNFDKHIWHMRTSKVILPYNIDAFWSYGRRICLIEFRNFNASYMSYHSSSTCPYHTTYYTPISHRARTPRIPNEQDLIVTFLIWAQRLSNVLNMFGVFIAYSENESS